LLRGPLTRAEVARLVRARPAAPVPDDGLLPHPPPLPDGLTARWLHPDHAAPFGPHPGDEPRWTAALYARFIVRFGDGAELIEERTVHRLARGALDAVGLAAAPPPRAVPLADAALHRAALPGGRYEPLPRWLTEPPDRLVRTWRDAAADEEAGPDEAPLARRDDVTVVGVALVWIPTPNDRSP
jgi:hypothetical protein